VQIPEFFAISYHCCLLFILSLSILIWDALGRYEHPPSSRSSVVCLLPVRTFQTLSYQLGIQYSFFEFPLFIEYWNSNSHILGGWIIDVASDQCIWVWRYNYEQTKVGHNANFFWPGKSPLIPLNFYTNSHVSWKHLSHQTWSRSPDVLLAAKTSSMPVPKATPLAGPDSICWQTLLPILTRLQDTETMVSTVKY
jgi:hypothetical protein